MQTVAENKKAFKETEIGLLPDDWELVKLGEIFDIKQGKAMSPKRRKGISPYPFLRTLNVLWGRLDLTTIDQMDFTEKEISNLRLTYGDLLVCEGGEIGRTAMWRNEVETCAHQNHIHRLRKLVEDIWPEFYMYWMQAAFLQFGLYSGEAIRTTIANLSGGRLQTFILPKPSFPEQQRISFILSKIQKAIEQQDIIIKTTENLKKSLMKKLFTEGIAHSEFKETEVGEIPKEWEVKSLKEIATLQRGKDLPKQNQVPGNYPIVGSSGVLGYHNKYFCEGPGVVTGRSGSIGKLTYIEGKHWAHNTGLYVKNFNGNHPKFVFYLLHTLDFKRYATGVSVPTLNRNFIHMALLPVPPLPEQKRIVEILNTMDSKIESEVNRKSVLQQLFKTMLSKLMSGKIRVNDLDLGDYDVN